MNSEMDDNVAYVPAGFHSPDSSLLLPSVCLPPLPSLSPSLYLSLFVGVCVCLPACFWRSLHPVESGTWAQLQRLTSSLSERRFSPPAICTLSHSVSVSLSVLLSPPLSHHNLATHSLYSSILLQSHPPSFCCLFYLHLHMLFIFQATTCERP